MCERCESVCGKLPISSCARGSNCSERRPSGLAAPAARSNSARALPRKAQAAVDRRPAAGLGVHEVARLAAPLPDATVGLPPVRDRGLDDLAEEAPLVVVRRVAASVPAPGEVEDLAVRVQLQ